MAEWVDALVSETSGDSPWGFDSLCRYSLSFGGWDCWEWSLGLHPGRQAGSMPASSTRTCTTLALVAQWTRVPGFEPGGWRFESSRGLRDGDALGMRRSQVAVNHPPPALAVRLCPSPLIKCLCSSLDRTRACEARGRRFDSSQRRAPHGEWGLAIRQLSYGCAKPVRFRRSLSMVAVAQNGRAPGCGPGGCRFEPGRSPLLTPRGVM